MPMVTPEPMTELCTSPYTSVPSLMILRVTTASSAMYCGGMISLLGINLPEFLIKIEFRNNIYQLHIGFPVGAEGSHILPVAVVFIGKKTLSLLVAIRDDMLAEIAAGLTSALAISASLSTFQLNM